MAWQISDIYGIEDELKDRGDHVWDAWDYVLPVLLDDPHPTNQLVRITQSQLGYQIWLPGTEVYVAFFLTDDEHVLLLDSTDLEEEFK